MDAIETIQNNEGLTVGEVRSEKPYVAVGVATDICWGVGPITPEMLPVEDAPAGEQRIVLGQKMAATLYVKTENAVRVFTLRIRNGKLWCDPKMEKKAVYSLPELQLP